MKLANIASEIDKLKTIIDSYLKKSNDQIDGVHLESID